MGAFDLSRRQFVSTGAAALGSGLLGARATAAARRREGLSMASLANWMRQIEQGIEAGPFEAGWESLRAFEVPAWYLDG